MARVVIVDLGLLTLAGHHFHHTHAISDALKRRGIASMVLGHTACDDTVASALGVHRIFTASPHVTIEAPAAYYNETRWIVLNQKIEHDLSQAALPAFDHGDVILMHTETSEQAFGLFQWYSRLPHPRPRMCLQFMFAPGFRVAADDVGVATALYARTLKAWRNVADADVRLAADNPALADRLQELAGGRVDCLPMPVRMGSARASSGTDLVFAGELRSEKGFLNLLSALSVRQGRGKENSIRVVMHLSAGQLAREFIDHVNVSIPNVSIINRTMNSREYEALIATSAAVLLPYSPKEYACRSSRLFVEALALAKPVLVTDATWMSTEVLRLASLAGAAPGVVATDDTPPALADALDRLIEGLPRFPSAATAVSEYYRTLHSPDAFVDAILQPAPS